MVQGWFPNNLKWGPMTIMVWVQVASLTYMLSGWYVIPALLKAMAASRITCEGFFQRELRLSRRGPLQPSIFSAGLGADSFASHSCRRLGYARRPQHAARVEWTWGDSLFSCFRVR